MRLYDAELSGNAYKVRLFLSLLGRDCERRPVNSRAGENRTPEYLALNPLGQIPVLEDDGIVLRDSQAILVYLARKYGGEQWLPSDAEGLARVHQWLSNAANEIARGPAFARACIRFGRQPLEPAQAIANTFLPVLNRHLEGRDWLEMSRPTIADLACYPYVALAPEGGLPLEGYPAILAWCGRVESLPGYTPMPGLPVAASG